MKFLWFLIKRLGRFLGEGIAMPFLLVAVVVTWPMVLVLEAYEDYQRENPDA